MAQQYVLTNSAYIFETVLGFILIFAGNILVNLTEKKKNLVPFVRYVLSMGFAYGVMLLRNAVAFFIDYYSKNTCLQKFTAVPADNLWLFSLLGRGIDNIEQYPVFDIDLTFFSFFVGSFTGGIVLWAYYVKKAGANGLPKAQKLTFKQYLQAEATVFKNSIHKWEYALWWTLRIAMTVAILLKKNKGDTAALVLGIMCLNLSLTFIIPLCRLLFFKKIFLGNLPYRVQSYIDIFIFAGSFLGHGCSLLTNINEYDKIEHFVAGAVTLIIGYVILKSLQQERLTVSMTAIGASGFAGVVAVIWEIFEFFSDYFIVGANNQNLYFEPTPDMLFVLIFGSGAQKTAQYPVLDTQIDIIFAVMGLVIALPFLCLWIRRQNRKNDEISKNQQAVPV